MGGLDICYGRWDTHEHSIVNKDDKLISRHEEVLKGSGEDGFRRGIIILVLIVKRGASTF